MHIEFSNGICFDKTFICLQEVGRDFRAKWCRNAIISAGSQSSFGNGTVLHEPLRLCFRTIINLRHVDRALLSEIAVEGMNSTIAGNCFVPSRPVFGGEPRLPVMSTELPKQNLVLENLANAVLEISWTVRKRKVESAVQTRSFQQADYFPSI